MTRATALGWKGRLRHSWRVAYFLGSRYERMVATCAAIRSRTRGRGDGGPAVCMRRPRIIQGGKCNVGNDAE